MNEAAMLIGLVFNAAAVLVLVFRRRGGGTYYPLRDRLAPVALMAAAVCCYAVAVLGK